VSDIENKVKQKMKKNMNTPIASNTPLELTNSFNIFLITTDMRPPATSAMAIKII